MAAPKRSDDWKGQQFLKKKKKGSEGKQGKHFLTVRKRTEGKALYFFSSSAMPPMAASTYGGLLLHSSRVAAGLDGAVHTATRQAVCKSSEWIPRSVTHGDEETKARLAGALDCDACAGLMVPIDSIASSFNFTTMVRCTVACTAARTASCSIGGAGSSSLQKESSS